MAGVLGFWGMYDADECVEGYICGLRTTVTVMRTTPSPKGYYTKFGLFPK